VGFPLNPCKSKVQTRIYIKAAILAYFCLHFSGCAVYTIEIHLADGTSATGTAIVVNNSEDVQLTVESEAFTATFGKVGTDGAIQAETISNAVTGAIGAAVGL
jgi:hypothetical protein